MGDMVYVKDDKTAAEEYMDLYMSLRAALREGKIETSDVEDYLSYKEKLLSKGARKLAQEMMLHLS